LIRMVLRNDDWERIAPGLPGKGGDPGVTARDNRLFVEAVLWIARTDCSARPLSFRCRRKRSRLRLCIVMAESDVVDGARSRHRSAIE
jgi:hypothetical protein